MSDFHPDTKGAVLDTFFFLRFICSIMLWQGRDAANKTGVYSQCLSHTGPAPTHGACSLPAHTAQALGCSTGNHPRLALGCMHLPGLSRSGSGIGVVLRGADSVGLCFVPFPGPSSSGGEVFGECSSCDLSPPPSLPLGFLSVQPAHLLRRMLIIQNPKKS